MTNKPLLVLAGGFGTRLRSAVGTVPKPLAPAGDKPFLLHLLENWVGQGARRFVFMLHHQSDVMVKFLDEASATTLRGSTAMSIVETTALGTGGAVANAVRELGIREPFLVANADTWLGDGLQDLAATEAPAVAVVRVENTQRYGAVRLEDDRIASFEEKRESGPGWINAGLYHLAPDEFAAWDGQAFSLESRLLPAWARDGSLKAVRLDTDFIDIGIPEDYLRFCSWAESGKSGQL